MVTICGRKALVAYAATALLTLSSAAAASDAAAAAAAAAAATAAPAPVSETTEPQISPGAIEGTAKGIKEDGASAAQAAAETRKLSVATDLLQQQELPPEHIYARNRPTPRRLQLLQLPLQQLQQPLQSLHYPLQQLAHLPHPLQQLQQLAGSNIFSSGNLSPRDKDTLETYSRHVYNSRERLYKDLVFLTGSKQQGIDEYAMKQLVAKVGLENLTNSNISNGALQLTQEEEAVLAAASRSKLQVDRIIKTYEREVQQHQKQLQQQLKTDPQGNNLSTRVDAIATDGLYQKRRLVHSLRRLQQQLQQSQQQRQQQQQEQQEQRRRLAASGGLLGTAGSLLRSIDPSNMNSALNTELGGLGLNHLHLPNIGGLRSSSSSTTTTTSSSGSSSSGMLQQVLNGILPQQQQAAAVAGPLRAFEQGVATATDGTVAAFLSKEGLDKVLDTAAAKQLLGGLIGGPSVAPRGISSWNDVVAADAAAELNNIMPFNTFLNKLNVLAHDVDAEVGVLKQDTQQRIRAEGVQLLPQQLLQLNDVMDQLVWGTLRAPTRRLQQVDAGAAPQLQQQQQPHHESQQQTDSKPESQQQTDSKPESQQQTDSKPESQQKTDSKPESQQKTDSIPESQQKTDSIPESQLQTDSKPESQLQTDSKPESQLQTDSKPESQQQTNSKPESLQQTNSKPESLQQTNSKPQSQQQTDSRQESQLQQQQDTDTDSEDDMDEEEELEIALLKVELLSEAVNVLLIEYEKAVMELQQQLQQQLLTAKELQQFLKEDVQELREEVAAARQQKQQQQQEEEQQQQQPPRLLQQRRDAEPQLQQPEQQHQQKQREEAAREAQRAYDAAVAGLRESMEGFLQQQGALPAAAHEQVAAIAAKIEAAAEEHLQQPIAAAAAAAA